MRNYPSETYSYDDSKSIERIYRFRVWFDLCLRVAFFCSMWDGADCEKQPEHGIVMGIIRK